jgi:hypothetical protein
LLDAKKTQNTLIALGRIRKTGEEIGKMIYDMDPTVLTVEVTQALLAIFPTIDELNLTKDYPNPESLDKVRLTLLCLFPSYHLFSFSHSPFCFIFFSLFNLTFFPRRFSFSPFAVLRRLFSISVTSLLFLTILNRQVVLFMN